MTDASTGDKSGQHDADEPTTEVGTDQPVTRDKARATGGGKQKVVFLGDSITQDGAWGDWFPELEAINLGVGGNTSDDVLARLDEVVALEPDAIVLMVGTNDLGLRQTVEHLVRNVETICVTLRKELPGSRMLVQSILPRGREYAQRIQDANRHLRQFTSTVHAQYLDLWPAFGLEDGELNPTFSEDRLHLNEAGYKSWASELAPALERLRELPPMTTPLQVIRTTDQYARPAR